MSRVKPGDPVVDIGDEVEAVNLETGLFVTGVVTSRVFHRECLVSIEVIPGVSQDRCDVFAANKWKVTPRQFGVGTEVLILRDVDIPITARVINIRYVDGMPYSFATDQTGRAHFRFDLQCEQWRLPDSYGKCQLTFTD